MTLKELAQLVYNVRSAQTRYFKTKSNETLEESKRLERELDGHVKEILWGQPKLFGEE